MAFVFYVDALFLVKLFVINLSIRILGRYLLVGVFDKRPLFSKNLSGYATKFFLIPREYRFRQIIKNLSNSLGSMPFS